MWKLVWTLVYEELSKCVSRLCYVTLPRIPRSRCCSWRGNQRRGSPASQFRPLPWSSLRESPNPRSLSRPQHSPLPMFPTRTSSFLTVGQHFDTHTELAVSVRGLRDSSSASAARTAADHSLPVRDAISLLLRQYLPLILTHETYY